MNEALIVAAVQAQWPHLLAVYAFGSRIQGTAGLASDLDLAVLVAGRMEPVPLWELSQQLADQLGCEVDLVDLRTASTVMQYQIITTGKVLWMKDAQAEIFECFILSEKTALDEARAGIIADIQCGGTVYGR